MENNKKALWVSEDMHHELSIFAAVNKIDIGKATELLVKLGLIEHKNTIKKILLCGGGRKNKFLVKTIVFKVKLQKCLSLKIFFKK